MQRTGGNIPSIREATTEQLRLGAQSAQLRRMPVIRRSATQIEMKLRHAAAVALVLGALIALVASVIFPSIRWQAIWTVVAVLLLGLVQMLIASFGWP